MFILSFFVPGISDWQCPTSYSGKLDNSVVTIPCGFYNVDVKVNTVPTSINNLYRIRIDGEFSSNARIESIAKILTGSDFIIQTSRDFVIILDANSYTSEAVIAQIKYSIMSGTSATVKTTITTLWVMDNNNQILCSGGANNPEITQTTQTKTLKGKVLIPSQFNCSGGNSTDHGLPNRVVKSNMNYSPYWEIGNSLTDGFGSYEITDHRHGCEYKVCVSKSNDAICGWDEFDYYILQQMININPNYCLDYAWQWYAGDINNNGSISTQDLIYLTQFFNNVPFTIPFKWKYVNSTEYNNLQQQIDCNNLMGAVPIVDNCMEVILTSNQTIEDWYGFPVGDITNSCTSCNLTTASSRTAVISESVPIFITKSGSKSLTCSFSYESPVAVWTLELSLLEYGNKVTNISLLNNYKENFTWSFDESSNMIRLVFGNQSRKEYKDFSFNIEFDRAMTDENIIKVSTELERIHNLIIHNLDHYSQFSTELITNLENIIIAPNPANEVIYFNKTLPPDHKIEIIDLTGRIVFSGKSQDNKAIKINNLSTGTYLTKIQSQVGTSFIKIVINN